MPKPRTTKSRKRWGRGIPKSRYHRERIRSSMKAFWKRTRALIEQHNAQQEQPAEDAARHE